MKERPEKCVSAIDCASRCPYRVMLEDGRARFEDMALLELLQLRTQIEGEICKRLGAEAAAEMAAKIELQIVRPT